MSKILVRHKKSGFYFNYDTIGTIVTRLQEYVNIYGPDAWIERYIEYGEEYHAIFVMEEETDKEYETRVKWEKSCTARELKQYKTLKKKFGSLDD